MRRFTHTFPQRISAFLLCLALLVGLLPATALAKNKENVKYLDEDGNEQTRTDVTTIVDTTTITLDGSTTGGWYVVKDVVNIAQVTVKDAVHLILADGCNLNVSDGIVVEPENSLTIYAQSTEDSMGKLTATGSTPFGAGIGGGYNGSGGRVTINGGTVTATGSGGAGIGGGYNGSGGRVTINGGTVTATGGGGGAGIGGGTFGSGDTVTIKGGTVTATGNGGGAGIGGGSTGSGGAVTIKGGTVTATAYGGGAGIGDGTSGYDGTVTINGNTVVYASAGIITAAISDTSNISQGIVFQKNEGRVYGNVTLQEDLTIESGQTLDIPSGASLNTGDYTLTVDGGTLTGNVTGKVTYKVTGVSLSNDSLTLDVGDTATLTATITPSNATNPNVTWSSNPSGIVTITPDTSDSKKATITATGTGTTTITATAADGSGEKATCTVTVTQPVTSVSLDKTSLELTEGETAQLNATVEPDNASNKSVTWASSNSAVATVDQNGNVEAVGAGTATITVTTEDGNYTAACTVTVEKPYTPPPYIPPTYAVTAPETTGGTVEVSPSRASSGRRVTITTQPAPGYELESLTVLDSRGSEIALTDQGDGKYTFTMPSRKVTVQASFAPVSLPFTDVAEDVWYEEAVRYAYFHNIMEGMSATKFSPNISLTRAQAVQVLYNLEGQPTVSESATFPDLVYQWYKPAISWAEQTGVVDGYEDGTFRPDQPVTRQEFAQMLYNYGAYKDYDLSAQGDLTAFPDGDSVQAWAETAMTWANGNQLINGHDDGTLEPGGTTTRAQAASILMRFDQKLAE